MTAIRNTFRDLLRYPSAVVGLFIILLLILTAIYAMIKIPYGEAIRLWRGSEVDWYTNPKNGHKPVVLVKPSPANVNKLKRKIKGALSYPVVVLCIAAAITVGTLNMFLIYITSFYARLDSMSRMVSASRMAMVPSLVSPKTW